MAGMSFHEESRAALLQAARLEARHKQLSAREQLTDDERAELDAVDESLTFKWDYAKRTAFFNGFITGIAVESARKMLAGFDRHDREKKASGAIELALNSPGGFATQGIAIYNLIRGSGREVNITALGTAYSAASLVFEAGAKRKLGTGASLGIHKAWVLAIGNSEDLLDMAERLERTDRRIMEIYTERAGAARADAIAAAMKKDTALTSKEAAELGLADAGAKPAEGKAQGADASLAEAGLRGEDVEKAAEIAAVLAAANDSAGTSTGSAASPAPSAAAAKDVMLSLRLKSFNFGNPSNSQGSDVKSLATS